MRILLITLFLSGLMHPAWCQKEEEVLAEVRRITGLPVTSFAYYATAPPPKAWRAYRNIWGFFRHTQPDVFRKASLQIANNPAVGVFVEKELKPIPHRTWNVGERMALLEPLGTIPAEWSVRILGKYLMDETPMTGEPPIDTDTITNDALAAWGLSQLGFSDAPTHGDIGELSDKNLAKWRQWWITNEPRLSERIREINPDYHPQPLSVAAQTTPSPATTKTPANSPAPADSIPSAKANSDNRLLLIGIAFGIALLVVISFAAQRLKRRKEN